MGGKAKKKKPSPYPKKNLAGVPPRPWPELFTPNHKTAGLEKSVGLIQNEEVGGGG